MKESLDSFFIGAEQVLIKSLRTRQAGHVTPMAARRGVYRVLLGKPKGERPLGRSRHRWEDNSKTDFQEVGWGVVDCSDLARDRDRWRALINAVMNLRVP
jgi:hypothetical protein